MLEIVARTQPATTMIKIAYCPSPHLEPRSDLGLPALKARNFPAPTLFKIASAMIERAELPVHRNSTLNG